MKIRTRVKAICVVFVALVFFLAVMFVVITKQINEAIRNNSILSEMTKEISELNILTADYLIHPGRRDREQVMAKRRNIGKLLEKIRFVDEKEKFIVTNMGQDLKDIEATYSKLSSGYSGRAPNEEGVFLLQEYRQAVRKNPFL